MLLFDILRIKTSIKNTPKRLKLKEYFILMFGVFFIETEVEEPGRRIVWPTAGYPDQQGTNSLNWQFPFGRR